MFFQNEPDTIPAWDRVDGHSGDPDLLTIGTPLVKNLDQLFSAGTARVPHIEARGCSAESKGICRVTTQREFKGNSGVEMVPRADALFRMRTKAIRLDESATYIGGDRIPDAVNDDVGDNKTCS